MTSEYTEANRANWDERVASHVIAYNAEELADDPNEISGVAREDARLLAPHLPGGSVAGLDLLHLQCHIGTDTLSWARLGAASVTGTDFSGEAIRAARMLAERAGIPARFEQCANEDAPATLGRQYDVVVTSIGVLVWLPRLDTWARAIHDLLRPRGVFFVRDGHPMMSAMAWDRDDDLLVAEHSYFTPDVPWRDDSGMSYIGDHIAENATTYEWAHSLSEILGSVLAAGLVIEAFDEHTTIPWNQLPQMVPSGDDWMLPRDRGRMPLTFSLAARRPYAPGSA
jgi:SAM-dependent methyltransferase